MPRTTPAPIVATLAGTVTNPLVPDATGDIIPAGDTLLVVACGATPTTVTIPSVYSDSGLPLGSAGGTVAANTSRVFGPFPARLFAQASDAAVGPGAVLVNYSSVATVTRHVISR